MFPAEAEIVVIGGGIVGSSTAYFLAQAGKKVVLIEKGYRSGEASGANAAWVWSLSTKAGIDIRLAMHSIQMHLRLQQELDMGFEYVHKGGLLVIDGEEQIPFVEAHVCARAEDGYPLEMIDAKQTLELEPMLSEKKIMGAGGKVAGVVTDKGTIKTETVVNAAGSWSCFIGEMVGLKVPVTPFQMAMLVTEPLPPCVSHPIMGASYMVEEDSGKEGEPGCGLIVSQQVSGNLLIGASWRDAGYDKTTIPEEIERIARINVEAMPALKDVRVIRSYANFFPHTEDDLPILGKVDGIEGFIMAAGHNGHGIGLGPGSGKLIQELICDEKTSIPLEELSLSRFN